MAGEVLRRKVMAGQSAPPDGGPGADRAWRLGFARAARDMMQLPVDFIGLTVARLSLAELLDLPPERALILMLEGPEDGLGLLILSPDLLTALVEVLTMGRCGNQPPDSRKPTRTDAAMISPLADLALANLEESLAEEGDLVWTSGFRYASFIEEARPLGLLLEDVSYRTLSAKLSLFHGARVGDMVLVLPAEGRGRKPKAKVRSLPDAVARPAFAAALAARVDAAPCQMEAVLARLSMPLHTVTQLEVGQILALPTATLDRISLEGLDARRVTEGRLGQHRGMRAVRLTGEDMPQVHVSSQSGLPGPTASAVSANLASGVGGEAQAEHPGFGAQTFDFASFPATGTD